MVRGVSSPLIVQIPFFCNFGVTKIMNRRTQSKNHYIDDVSLVALSNQCTIILKKKTEMSYKIDNN